jgi:polysaccharide biosynthesis transport protein
MSELSPFLIRRNQPIGRLSAPRAARPDTTDGIGMDEIWRVIRRRLWTTGPLVFAIAVIATSFLFLMTPNFTGKATLLIEPDDPQVLNITQLLGESAGDPNYDYYKTEFELLKNRALAARVIRELNLTQEPLLNPKPPEKGSWAEKWNSFKGSLFSLFRPATSDEPSLPDTSGVDPDVIDRYLSHLRVEPVAETRLVTVSFSLPDAKMAARIANAHVDYFIKRELEIRSTAQRAAEGFLRSQLRDISKQTEQAEANLNAYRQRNGVLTFDVNDTNNLGAQRMSQLTRALTDAETRRITAQSEVELVEHGDYASLPQVISNPTISALKPQLVALEAEYARLSSAFNPTYPKLVELKAQLYQDRHDIALQMRNAADAVRRDYNAAVAQETRLRNELNAEKRRDLALNDALLKDAVLAREVQTDRDLYKNILQRTQEMSVASRTTLSNINIVERAVPPRYASSPRKRLDLAITVVAAMLIGIALSFVMEHFDNRLKTPEEIEEHLNLPSLAIVPDFAKLGKVRGSRKLFAQNHFENSSLISSSGKDKAPLGLDRYMSGASEVYRTIRTNILFSQAGSPPRTVLFASAIEAEGKTWTAIHTAAVLAHTGATTLLVSSDLRRPRCDRLLNCEGRAGLSDALVGLSDLDKLINPIDKGFFFLSAGSRVPNPAELLSSVRMHQIIGFLAERYAFVLFDSAPLMYANETLALGAMVDGVVLVVGARTSKHSVRLACNRLAVADAKILGVVLNGVDTRHPDYREYTKYYYRYA